MSIDKINDMLILLPRLKHYGDNKKSSFDFESNRILDLVAVQAE